MIDLDYVVQVKKARSLMPTFLPFPPSLATIKEGSSSIDMQYSRNPFHFLLPLIQSIANLSPLVQHPYPYPYPNSPFPQTRRAPSTRQILHRSLEALKASKYSLDILHILRLQLRQASMLSSVSISAYPIESAKTL